MVKRRSLDDALSPEEEAFLKQGKAPKPKTTKPKPKPEPRKEKPPMARSAVKQEFEPANMSAASGLGSPASSSIGSINARVDSAISEALMRASLERRIQRIAPSTHREIVAEALTDWLKKHGFMN